MPATALRPPAAAPSVAMALLPVMAVALVGLVAGSQFAASFVSRL